MRLDFGITKPPSATRVSFYGWLALAAITLSVAAFGPSLVSSSQRRGSMTVMAGTHAVLMSAWLILYLIQAMLAANGGIGLHKRLGVAGAVVAAAAVATGFAATVAMVQRGFDSSGDLSRPPNDSALDAAIFQFSNLAIFSILVGAALALRHLDRYTSNQTVVVEQSGLSAVGVGFAESIIAQQAADRVAEIIATKMAENELRAALPPVISVGEVAE